MSTSTEIKKGQVAQLIDSRYGHRIALITCSSQGVQIESYQERYKVKRAELLDHKPKDC